MKPVQASAYVQVDLVDLVDDLQVSGQERLQQVHRPAFQSFRQDCVVGVGEGASGEVPGLQGEWETEPGTLSEHSQPLFLDPHPSFSPSTYTAEVMQPSKSRFKSQSLII